MITPLLDAAITLIRHLRHARRRQAFAVIDDIIAIIIDTPYFHTPIFLRFRFFASSSFRHYADIFAISLS
jgi:hypothetical protein